MLDAESDRPLQVAVWIRDRSPPPGDPRRKTIARLRDMESAGVVDDVTVKVWGEAIDVPSDGLSEGRSAVHEQVAEFEEWADLNDHSLEPAFSRCTRASLLSDEEREIMRLPLQCLAVYADDSLVAVAPCSTADGTNTVQDCLLALDADMAAAGTDVLVG